MTDKAVLAERDPARLTAETEGFTTIAITTFSFA